MVVTKYMLSDLPVGIIIMFHSIIAQECVYCRGYVRLLLAVHGNVGLVSTLYQLAQKVDNHVSCA